MQKRTIIFYAGFMLALCGIVTQLYQITTQGFAQAANEQATTTVRVGYSRGTIYDRKLRPLVNQKLENRACISPVPSALSRLSEQLDKDTFLDISSRLQQGRPVVYRLSDRLSPVNGVIQFTVPVRTPDRLLAPHLIGYMDSDGIHGKTGIEKLYDDLLNQYAGKAEVTYTVDATGHPLSGIEPKISNTLERSVGGIALTIDQDIQLIAERAAQRYLTKGSILVMEADTGNILAMTSTPSFQPDTVASVLDDPSSPLLNRSVSNYNCGSVFKIVTAAAALEAGVSPDRKYTCTGSVDIDGVVFHCHNRLGHGRINMTEAFATSCNSYFIQLMQDVGPRPLYQMTVNLGFDRSILLAPEFKTARAILPSLEELQVPAALANLSFGQGSLMATPVHIAQLVGAVVNDGKLLRPNVILGTVDEHKQLTIDTPTPAQYAFSPETARQLQQMMVAAVQDGATGQSARPPLLGAGGKTGTAETGWVSGESGETAIQSWFAGYYPAQQPKYVIVVLAEDSGATNAKATPAFKQICEELYAYEFAMQRMNQP